MNRSNDDSLLLITI